MIHIPRKLIFIKPKKVGGSTVEFLLSAICSPYDAITPLDIAEDCDRLRYGYQLPINVFISKDQERCYHNTIRELCNINESTDHKEFYPIKKSVKTNSANALKQNTEIRNHASLKRVREFVGNAAFRSTALVSICRHPFELAVSQAFWNLGKGEASDLDQALNAVVSRPHFNIRRYGLHRRWRREGTSLLQATPFTLIIRLEDLVKEIPVLSELAQRDLPTEIPHLKGGARLDHRPAEAILSNTQKRNMERHNRPLFELWDNPPRP